MYPRLKLASYQSPEMHLNSDVSKVMPWLGVILPLKLVAKCVPCTQPVGIWHKWDRQSFLVCYHLLLDADQSTGWTCLLLSLK